MVFVYLARHWLARRHYSFSSWWACIARSLRVLLFYRAHRQLLELDIYRKHLTQVHDDVFHHLSHRNYLSRQLTLRQRVACVLAHYRFEEAHFDAAYQQAVYRDGGLPLWRRADDDGPFELRLEMASRLNAEGDLTVIALAGGRCLHRLSFSWVDGAFAGIDAAPLPSMLPFIARNQGHRASTPELAGAFSDFERAFPNNSPSFFCFAALQGIALALGMGQAVAVKSSCQCAYDPADDKRFANAYDGFWQTLGGVAMPGHGWRIVLPFHQKPLADMAAKHRKRAAMRRAYWREIGESAGMAIKGHLAHGRASAAFSIEAPLRETAQPVPS
jgi:uncharacterized protein VirK/YbjX